MHPVSSAPAARLAAAALPLLLCALAATPLRAQSLDDGLMVPRRVLGAGVSYAHDRWDRYWEGTLRRDNENIGTLTTRSVTWMAGYGVTDRLSVLAMLPYVQTHASQGPLHDMEGVQDLTVAAKLRALEAPVAGGTLGALLVGAAGLPIGDYTPDFLPLSIGLASRRVSGRLTLSYQADNGLYLDASGAHTWRGKVKLDRDAYYTEGKLYLTNEVAMPRVADVSVGTGYRRGRLHLPLSLTRQRTLGGGDIRRQDMPFVSNRMDFVRVDGGVGYTVPATRMAIRLGAGRVLSGRNVGQATTFTAGVSYTLLTTPQVQP